jgi:lipoate-protein ligase A
MTAALRIIDTGERPARWNVAATAALTQLHCDGVTGDTLRFHRYPASVLIGRHQDAEQAIRVDACRQAGVEIARRVTGGGSVYMAPGALAWDLIISRKRAGRDVGDVAQAIGKAVAAGIAHLGLDARYRAENEIVVAGRKLCGMSGYHDGDTIAYQGTILIDTDLSDMGRCLRMPFPSGDAAQALTARMTTVSEWLNRKPDPHEVQSGIGASLARALRCEPAYEEIAFAEKTLADEYYRETYGRDAFVFADPSSGPEAMAGEAGQQARLP